MSSTLVKIKLILSFTISHMSGTNMFTIRHSDNNKMKV